MRFGPISTKGSITNLRFEISGCGTIKSFVSISISSIKRISMSIILDVYLLSFDLTLPIFCSISNNSFITK